MIALVMLVERKITCFLKKHHKNILSGLFVGVIAYFMMMSSNLVNDLDGIWHPSNFIAGDWEISLGRGLQRYADRARFGIVSDSFNSFLTLSLIAIANALIIEKLELNNSIYKYLVIFIFIANPVICNSLSYSYMSVNFGLAYLFCILSFACLKKEDNAKKAISRVLLAGIFIGISLAFYQAYISVTCILFVVYALKILLEEERIMVAFKYLFTCVGAIVWGGIIYLVITNALLLRANIQMASYKGAANISLLSMIINLPNSLKQCYVEYANYFVSYKAMSNLEFIEIVLVLLLLVYVIAVILRFWKLLHCNIFRAFLFLFMLILVPVAACFVLILAVGNTMSGLMSMGIVVSTVILSVIVPQEGKVAFWIKRAHLLILVAFAWFQLSAVVNDQLALKEGKTATITLTENIVARLYEEKYLDEYQVVAFVGRPANNDRFAQSVAYHMANGYAQFGCWSTDARNNKVSWEGVLSNFLGINLIVCGESDYSEIISLEQVAEMPEFPATGSICVIEDIIVVKVSEVY